MKPTLLGISVAFALILVAPVIISAQELPFGVSPKEITISGTIDIPDSGSFGLDRSGKLLNNYEYKEGNRVGVQLDSVSYSLHFWNVGKLGGTSGYLFWKKDFSKATLFLEYNSKTNGQFVGEKVDNSKFGLPDGWKMEPAESEPEIKSASCGLTFSGGPTGTFKGTCNNGSVISGRVASGSFVVFDNIKQPDNYEDQEFALGSILSKDLRLNGEFGDWKFDESTLEDVGARFSSMTGEVEVRHEKDTEWNFAKLDTVLYLFDHVKTGEESQAIIGFADLSTFLLKAESEIVVTSPPKKDSKIGLVYGNIKANIKKMLKDGTMEVEMSQAVSGIKGTRFELTETGTESSVAVTEGTVAFTSKATGETVMVAAGEAVTATSEGLSEKTTFDAKVADELLLRETDVANQPVLVVSDIEESNYTLHFTISIGLLSLVGGSLYYWTQRKKKVIEIAEVKVPEQDSVI